MTFANYYKKFASIVQTMEDEDTIPAFKRITAKATKWKSNVTAGSKKAVKVGQLTSHNQGHQDSM